MTATPVEQVCPACGKPLLIQAIDLAGMRDQMRAVLASLGLWRPENFGIWTALNYS